jgi:hypothetical protein
MQSMSENDFECFASTGVNTPGTMSPESVAPGSQICITSVRQPDTNRTPSRWYNSEVKEDAARPKSDAGQLERSVEAVSVTMKNGPIIELVVQLDGLSASYNAGVHEGRTSDERSVFKESVPPQTGWQLQSEVFERQGATEKPLLSRRCKNPFCGRITACSWAVFLSGRLGTLPRRSLISLTARSSRC